MLEALFEKFGVRFASGQMIFCEYEPGEECYFVLEGKVKITKVVGNTQKTLDVIEKGHFFGEMALLEAEPRSASAIAIETVRTLKFNRSEFETMMSNQPQLAFRLLVIFCSRIYDAKRRLQILLLKEPQLKVSDVFVMLAEKQPEAVKESSRMVFHVTTDDVASWCGLPVQEVQRIMNLFVRRGRIEVYVDYIVIHNINDFIRLITYHRKNLNA